MKFLSPAKLNLNLRVISKRIDGYHNLETTFQFIDAGLGGGSSNAATTLIALNKIWDLDLSREELAKIGKPLGADIPIFIYGKNAIAEGIGDVFLDVEFRKNKFLLICPNIEVSTGEMFRKLKIDKLSSKHQNSFLDTLLRENKSIEEFYASNISDYDLKLSGTGSTLFIEYDKKDDLKKILQKIPKNWRFFFCEGLQYSPLTGV